MPFTSPAGSPVPWEAPQDHRAFHPLTDAPPPGFSRGQPSPSKEKPLVSDVTLDPDSVKPSKKVKHPSLEFPTRRLPPSLSLPTITGVRSPEASPLPSPRSRPLAADPTLIPLRGPMPPRRFVTLA